MLPHEVGSWLRRMGKERCGLEKGGLLWLFQTMEGEKSPVLRFRGSGTLPPLLARPTVQYQYLSRVVPRGCQNNACHLLAEALWGEHNKFVTVNWPPCGPIQSPALLSCSVICHDCVLCWLINADDQTRGAGRGLCSGSPLSPLSSLRSDECGYIYRLSCGTLEVAG